MRRWGSVMGNLESLLFIIPVLIRVNDGIPTKVRIDANLHIGPKKHLVFPDRHM